jgi:hypothetical protein
MQRECKNQDSQPANASPKRRFMSPPLRSPSPTILQSKKPRNIATPSSDETNDNLIYENTFLHSHPTAHRENHKAKAKWRANIEDLRRFRRESIKRKVYDFTFAKPENSEFIDGMDISSRLPTSNPSNHSTCHSSSEDENMDIDSPEISTSPESHQPPTSPPDSLKHKSTRAYFHIVIIRLMFVNS